MGWRTTLWLVAALGAAAFAGTWLKLPPVPAAAVPSLGQRVAVLADTRVAATIAVSVLTSAGSIGLYTYVAQYLIASGGVGDPLPYLWAWSLGGLVGIYPAGMPIDATGRSGPVMTAVLVALAASFVVLGLGPTSPTLLLCCFAFWGAAAWSSQAPQQHRLLSLHPENGSVVLALQGSAHYAGSAARAALGGLALAAGASIRQLPLLSAGLVGAAMAGQLVIASARGGAGATRPLAAPPTRPGGAVVKAVRYRSFGGPEVLEYVDLPDPVPGHGEALIETTAIGVNCPDVRERLGVYNRAETRVGGVTLPHVGGLQVVGRVSATGPGVDPALRGRKVMALMAKGAYAQMVASRADLMVALPDDADDVAMAGVPCQGVTAFLALKVCTVLKPGESVLVHGAAGGVGGLAVQIAKALGAGPVIGTASGEDCRAFARGLGADHAIGYDDPDWPRTVLELTAGRGVDVILETIGGEVFAQNFECLATLGRCVVVGSTRGPGAPLEPRRLMARAQSVSGLYLPTFHQRPDLIQRALRFLAEGVARGTIKVSVSEVIPLSRAAQAHELLERRAVRGVLILDPSGLNGSHVHSAT